MDGPPPPPPPPHGTAPGSGRARNGLPDGPYDIIVIPPHSAGAGIIYLPSLRTHTNSFMAGSVCTFVSIMLWRVCYPVIKEWYIMTVSKGGPGVLVLIIGVGVLAWALGRAQFDTSSFRPAAGPGPGPGPGEPHDRGYGNGHGPGYGPGPGPGPDPGPGGGPGFGSERGYSGSHANGSTPGGGYAAGGGGPPPKPGWQRSYAGANGAGPGRTGWERAREETRKREEDRRKKEEAEKKAKEAAWERIRTREREAREREAREREAKEKEARERELKEREVREREEREREAREREAKEREMREREVREREAREREARDREAQAREAQEKEAREKAAREKAAQEREARIRAAREARQKEALEREARERTAREKENINFKPPERPTPRTPSPTKASPASPSSSPRKHQQPTAKTYLGTEAEEHSFRPYDKAKRPPVASQSSVYSESSYAPSQTTARTTPPPSHRGPYSTKDPDKIVIKAVYKFSNTFAKVPTTQLVSGVGSVTDGLILRVTTEGLFIDDDVRSVPQREWDVKAWTMKSVEV